MRHSIDQGRSQLFALPRGFHLMCEVLCPRAFQSNCNQIRYALQDGVGHWRAL